MERRAQQRMRVRTRRRRRHDGARRARASTRTSRARHHRSRGRRRILRRMTGYGYMPGYSLDGTVLVVDASNPALSGMDGTDVSHLQEQATRRECRPAQQGRPHRRRSRRGGTTHARATGAGHTRRVVRIMGASPRRCSSGCPSSRRRSMRALCSPNGGPTTCRSIRVPRGRRRARTIARGASWPTRRSTAWSSALGASTSTDASERTRNGLPPRRTATSPDVSLSRRQWRLDRGASWGDDPPATRLLLAGVGSGGGGGGGAQRPASRAERTADGPEAPDLGAEHEQRSTDRKQSDDGEPTTGGGSASCSWTITSTRSSAWDACCAQGYQVRAASTASRPSRPRWIFFPTSHSSICRCRCSTVSPWRESCARCRPREPRSSSR